jgi:hypothetical protein
MSEHHGLKERGDNQDPQNGKEGKLFHRRPLAPVPTPYHLKDMRSCDLCHAGHGGQIHTTTAELKETHVAPLWAHKTQKFLMEMEDTRQQTGTSA